MCVLGQTHLPNSGHHLPFLKLVMLEIFPKLPQFLHSQNHELQAIFRLNSTDPLSCKFDHPLGRIIHHLQFVDADMQLSIITNILTALFILIKKQKKY